MEIFASHHHLQNQHSLSQDSTSEGSLMMIGGQGPPPPPTLSRLPPDGHEFPPDYRDPSASSSSNSNNFQVSIHITDRYYSESIYSDFNHFLMLKLLINYFNYHCTEKKKYELAFIFLYGFMFFLGAVVLKNYLGI